MQHTNNLNLNKPDLDDDMDITKLNANADIIDQKILEIENSVTAEAEVRQAGLATKANQTDVTNALAAKADQATVNNQLNTKASITYVDNTAEQKIDKITYYTEMPDKVNRNELQPLQTAIENKVDKVSGKDLSSNDFTNALKAKLEALTGNEEMPDLSAYALSIDVELQMQTKADVTTVNDLAATVANKADNTVVDVLQTAVNTKVDKIAGKGLSTNDFTATYKDKLDNLDGTLNNYALKTDIKQADWTQPQSTEPDFIKNKPALGTASAKDTGTTEGTVPLLGADGKLPESMIPSTYPTIEMGTWTPTVGSETDTPPEETNTNRQGVYTRIGNLVAVQFFYQATLANGTGVAVLAGLPFTPTKISTGATLLKTSATPWATALVNTGYTNKLRFYKDGTVVSLTGFSGTVNIRGSFIYLI